MATTSQTPRMKASKLSLDISSLLREGEGSPVSSLSPVFDECSSISELTALLKEAYNGIKEKERDLTLAAEIGKSILDNNISLKAKCEALTEKNILLTPLIPLKAKYEALTEDNISLKAMNEALTEENISLKTKCEALATQLQQLQYDRTRNTTFTLQAGAVIVIVVGIINSISNFFF